MDTTQERVRIIDDLISHYGKSGLLSILQKIAKLRTIGVDIDMELDKEIERLKGGCHG